MRHHRLWLCCLALAVSGTARAGEGVYVIDTLRVSQDGSAEVYLFDSPDDADADSDPETPGEGACRRPNQKSSSLRFDTKTEGGNRMFSLLLLARANKLSVSVEYEVGSGDSKHCRLTAVQL